MAPRKVLINMLAGVIIDVNLHWLFYVIIHAVSILHLCSIITTNNSQIQWILQWGNPIAYLHSQTILFFAIVVMLVVMLGLMLQICYAFGHIHHIESENYEECDSVIDSIINKNQMSDNNILKYIRIITTHLHILLITVYNIPLIYAVINILQNQNNNTFTTLTAITVIILYLLFIVPTAILMYFTNTLSLVSSVYRICVFPSNVHVLLIIRIIMPIFALLLPSPQLLLIPIIISFIILCYFSYITPVLYFVCESVHRIMLSCVLWFMVIRIIDQAYGVPLNGAIVLLGLPLAALGYNELTLRRLLAILEQQTPSILRFKILQHLLLDLSQNSKLLNLYLLHHRQLCNLQDCPCFKLLHLITNNDESAQQDQQLQQLWYRLISYNIYTHYNTEGIDKLLISQQKAILMTVREININLCEIGLHKLHHRNESYFNMMNCTEILEHHNLTTLLYQVQVQIIEFIMHMHIQQHKNNLINSNANQYLQYQFNREQFLHHIQKSTQQIHAFWQEMAKEQPDAHRLQSLVRRHQHYHNMMQKMHLKMINQFHQVVHLINQIIYPYLVEVFDAKDQQHFSHFGNIAEMNLNKSYKNTSLANDIKFYNLQAETGICIVNIHANKMGDIVHANQYFWKNINMQRQPLNIHQLIPQSALKVHRSYMDNYIHTDAGYISRILYFIDNNCFLVSINVSLHMLSQLHTGIKIVVFINNMNKQQITIRYLQSGHVTDYSYRFQTQILSKCKMEHITAQIDDKMLMELNRTQRTIFYVEQVPFYATLVKKGSNDDGQSSYYIKFQSQYTDNHLAHATIKPNQTLLSIKTKNTYKSFATFTDLSQFMKEKALIDFCQKISSDSKERHKAEFMQQFGTQIRNVQNCYVLLKWHLSILIIGILLIGLITTIIVHSFKRIQQSQNYSKFYSSYNKLINSIDHSIYNLRQLQLQAYPNNRSNYYAYNKKQLEYWSEILKDIKAELSGVLSGYKWTARDTFQSNKLQQLEYDAYTLISNYLQVSINIIINVEKQQLLFQPTYSSDCCESSSIANNFFSAIRNGLYSALPQLTTYRDSNIITETNGIIASQSNNYINYVAVVGMLLCAVCFGLLLLAKTKVHQIKSQTYKLLEYVQIKQIQDKIYKLSLYLSMFETTHESQKQITYAKYQQQQKNNQICPMKPIIMLETADFYQPKQSTQQPQLQFSNCRNQQNMPKVSQRTDRQMNIKHSSKKTDIHRNIFSNKRIKCTNIAIFSMFIIPIMYYLILIMVVQQRCIGKVTNGLSVQVTLQKRQLYLEMIKLYLVQLAFQNKSQIGTAQPISSIMTNLINQIYQVQRDIKSIISDDSQQATLTKFLSYYNNGNLCTQIHNLNITIDLINNFNSQQCRTILGNVIMTQGMRSAIIAYLKATQMLIYASIGINNQSSHRNRLQFVNQPIIKELIAMSGYFLPVNRQAISIQQQNWQAMLKEYQFTVIGLSAVMIVGVVLLFGNTLLAIKHALTKQLLQVKTVLNIISYQSIKNNDKIYKKVSQNSIFIFFN